MTSIQIPPVLQELFVKLRFVSMIQRDKKINMSSMSFVDSRSWMTSFTRRFMGENREGLLNFVDQTISQTITAIGDYSDSDFIHLLIQHLSEAKKGIENLKVTYEDSPHTVARISVFLDTIELQLSRNGKYLTESTLNIIE